MKKYKLVAIYFLSFVITANIYAHNIKIFAAKKSDNICGYVYSPGGIRIKNCSISVYRDSKLISKIKTDNNGAFIYKAEYNKKYKFAYNKDGHFVAYSVNMPAVKATKSENDNQIFEIKEQLDRIEKTMRIRDIIGAIGYIFGIAGLIILLKKKKL